MGSERYTWGMINTYPFSMRHWRIVGTRLPFRYGDRQVMDKLNEIWGVISQLGS